MIVVEKLKIKNYKCFRDLSSKSRTNFIEYFSMQALEYSIS